MIVLHRHHGYIGLLGAPLEGYMVSSVSMKASPQGEEVVGLVLSQGPLDTMPGVLCIFSNRGLLSSFVEQMVQLSATYKALGNVGGL